jgi:integrase
MVYRPPNQTPQQMSTRIWTDKKDSSLRLRWNFEGKRYQLALGVKDDPTGRSYAKMIEGTIERDLQCSNFDKTLQRYQNPHKRSRKPKVEELSKLTAVALFEQYAAVIIRDKDLAPGSVQKYKAIASKLRECLGDKLAHQVDDSIAKNAVAVMTETLSGQTVKTYLFLIRACWDWAKDKYHFTDTNPWGDCIGRVKIQSTKQVKPFTINELQAIIAAFKTHPHYCHYTEFVIFLSHTACRFGEVAGLRWGSLGVNFSTAWIGESISRGHQSHKGTKTGKTRTIQLLPSIRSMLVARYERLKPQPNDLVFPSPKGLAIDDHRFSERAWKTILGSCQIEYRKLYNLRHSAISHALHNGVNPIALAEQTGHDKRVMLSTYAHAIDRECLFVDFTLHSHLSDSDRF